MKRAASNEEMGKGLLIGRAMEDVKTDIGFSARKPDVSEALPLTSVRYDDEGHLMTIAPTGSGKGVSCVVPALLHHEGPVIVMDLKAENYAMTRRRRKELGSKVTCIDPFGVAKRIVGDTGDDIAGFNPFDLLPYLSDDRVTACRALADLLVSKEAHKEDPYWREATVGALAGLIDCYDRFEGPSRSITAIANDLSVDIPDTLGPGLLSGSDRIAAFAMHDPDFMDQIDDIDLSILEVVEIYRRTSSVSPLQEVRADVMAAKVAEVALDLASSELDPSSDDYDFETYLAEKLWGHDAKKKAFRTEIMKIGEDVDERLADAIFSRLNEISEDDLSIPEAGSLSDSYQDGAPGELQGSFPLALHFASLVSSELCRAVAAQPFTADRTWGSILASLRSEMVGFSGRSIARCLSGKNGVDLAGLERGDNVSIFIAFPPSRIRSHASLFRVIVEGMLGILVARTHRPQTRTLLLLDEIAQLGRLDILITAKTLLRGYGVQVWSFWQDISQLKANYPLDWPTIINNCRVLQVFGRSIGSLSSELAQALDVPSAAIAELNAENMLAWVDSAKPRTLKRPICYLDDDLKSLCDEGPFAVPVQKGSDQTSVAA